MADPHQPDRRPEAFDLDSQILRFDNACQAPGAHAPPDPLNFLVDDQGRPLADEPRRRLLIELVMIDMEYRWRHRRDQPGGSHDNPVGSHNPSGGSHESDFPAQPKVEDYLARYPELGSPASPPVALIVNEYRVRCRCGDPPSRAEILSRFDQRWELIAALGVVDRQLGRAPEPTPGGLQCRCPHCREIITVCEQADVVPVSCPQCGSSFSLVSELQSTGQPLKFGHFEFIERLGGGSFGTVWKARDNELKRTVAVKVAHRAAHESQAEAILVREARAAAALRHAGIVTVHEIGRQDDRTYVVSDYIEGQTLEQWAASRRPTFRQSAQLCRTIAEALHHAHTGGVIHRDLKPSNILIDAADAPYITDFGLAKRSATETTVAHDGKPFGTPAYMSPEQALGLSSECGPPTDVYSLGVVLFELLTGERPFRGDVAMILAQVIADEPPSPRKLNAHIPQDLATICVKCMEKVPAARYATGQDLADDLGRYLRGEPILARPVGRIARAWRWAKRNPLAVALASVITLSAIGLFAGGWWHIHRLNDQLAINKRLRDEAIRDEYITSMQLARKAFDEGKLDGTLQILRKYIPASDGDHDPRDFAWHYLWRCCHAWDLSIDGHPKYVIGVAWSSDGSRIATTTEDDTARVFDARDGRTIATLAGHMGEVNCALFVGGNDMLLTGDDGGDLRWWNITDRKLLHRVPAHKGNLFSIAMSPDGKSVASGGEDGVVRLWDLNTRKSSAQFEGHKSWLRGIAWHPDGRRLVTAEKNGPLRVWDLTTNQPPLQVELNLKDCVSFGLHPSGRLAAVGGSDARVQLLDVDEGKVTASWTAHDSWVKSVLFPPDGRTLITAGHDHKLIYWDISDPAQPREVRRMTAHIADVMAAGLSLDGTRLLTGSRDLSARVWRSAVEPEYDTLGAADSRVVAIALSPDEKLLAVAALQTLTVWDLPARRVLKVIPRDGKSQFSGAAFSPDGRWLAAASGKLRLWDTADLSIPPRVISGPTRPSYRVAIHPTLPWIATNENESHIGAWDLRDGGSLATFKVSQNQGFGLFEFSPDGIHLAALGLGYEGRVVVWRTADQSVVQRWEHRSSCLAFTPDGHRIATVGDDETIYLHDVRTGAEVQRLLGHTADVNGVAFSPDGRIAASTAISGRIKVWALDTGVELMQLGGKHTGYKTPLFTRNGSTLIVCGIRHDNVNEVLVFSAETPTGRVARAE